MIKDLVSIITPCYNSAGFVHRLLESILIQDYPFIEIFAIDDGSTDNTKEIIESYIPKFQKRGYELTYIYQKNAGQAAALNRGLKLISGEYLTWPDSDDYYNKKDSISVFVRSIQQLDYSYGAVCFIGTFVDDIYLKDLKWNYNYNKSDKLFEASILGGCLAVPINYMISTTAFERVNPQREIYTERRPQNMQMFMPLFYYYKCKTYKESLCNIVVRNNSDSHLIKPYEEQIDDLQGYLDIQLNTLDNMLISDRDKWKNICKRHITREKCRVAILFEKYHDAVIYKKILSDIGEKLPYKTLIKIQILRWPRLLRMFKLLKLL